MVKHKRRPADPDRAAPADGKLRAVRLELSAANHAALRRAAADAELPMSQFARQVVEKYLEEYRERR